MQDPALLGLLDLCDVVGVGEASIFEDEGGAAIGGATDPAAETAGGGVDVVEGVVVRVARVALDALAVAALEDAGAPALLLAPVDALALFLVRRALEHLHLLELFEKALAPFTLGVFEVVRLHHLDTAVVPAAIAAVQLLEDEVDVGLVDPAGWFGGSVLVLVLVRMDVFVPGAGVRVGVGISGSGCAGESGRGGLACRCPSILQAIEIETRAVSNRHAL